MGTFILVNAAVANLGKSNFETMYTRACSIANAHAYAEAGNDIMIYPCGFAWVDIRPKNCKFATWLQVNKHASIDPVKKTMKIWIGHFNQSVLHKEAYAEKLTELLKAEGIDASAGSRLD